MSSGLRTTLMPRVSWTSADEPDVDEMPVEAALELIGRSSIGRVALLSDGNLQVLPARVTLTADNHLILLFCEDRRREELDDAHVVVEIDHLDPQSLEGWVIEVVGHSQVEPVVGSTPWGRRAEVVPITITGRRLAHSGVDVSQGWFPGVPS
jgi:hypothetical protein